MRVIGDITMRVVEDITMRVVEDSLCLHSHHTVGLYGS
jgi:hypothetical protein